MVIAPTFSNTTTGNWTVNSHLLKGFQPSEYVQYASMIPVMSHALAKMGGVQGGDPRFAPTSFKYLATIVALPATAFLLGVISMFLMNVGLMLRWCFRQCACFPTKASREDNSRRRWRLTASLWLFSFLLLVTVGLLYLADSNLDLGIAELQRLLYLMNIVLSPIDADAKSLASVGNSLTTSLTAAKTACNSAAAMSTTISTLATQTKLLAGLMSALMVQVETVMLYVDLYLASAARRQALYALAALPILLALGFMGLSCSRCSAALKVLLGSGVVYYYLAVTMLLPIAAVVSLLSDVCSDPFNKVLQAAPPGGRVYNLTYFYTTCKGDNIAGQYLDATWLATVTVNSSVSALLGTTAAGGACSATEKNLLSMRQQSGLALSTMTLAARRQHLPSCPLMHSIYTSLVNDAVCGYLFMGMLQVAGALAAGTLALWLCVLVASILSPHLDPAFFQQQMVYAGDGDDEEGKGEGEGEGERRGHKKRQGGWSLFGRGGDDDDYEEEGDDEEDEEGYEGEGKRGDDRVVHADVSESQAEREGKSTAFDWASLSDDRSFTGGIGGGAEGAALSRIPDEEDEEDDELVSIGGWGTVAGGMGMGVGGDGDGGGSGSVSGSVSVLTRDVPRGAWSPEDALHGLAVVPAGREDDL